MLPHPGLSAAKARPSTGDAIYEHFTSTRSKIDLIIRLNGILTAEPACQQIRAMMDEAVTLNTMRNKYVHALWAIDETNPDAVQRIPQTRPQASAKYEKFEPEWLTIERIKADIGSIAHWSDSLLVTLSRIDPWRLSKAR